MDRRISAGAGRPSHSVLRAEVARKDLEIYHQTVAMLSEIDAGTWRYAEPSHEKKKMVNATAALMQGTLVEEDFKKEVLRVKARLARSEEEKLKIQNEKAEIYLLAKAQRR
jgi:hypothetical protein